MITNRSIHDVLTEIRYDGWPDGANTLEIDVLYYILYQSMYTERSQCSRPCEHSPHTHVRDLFIPARRQRPPPPIFARFSRLFQLVSCFSGLVSSPRGKLLGAWRGAGSVLFRIDCEDAMTVFSETVLSVCIPIIFVLKYIPLVFSRTQHRYTVILYRGTLLQTCQS